MLQDINKHIALIDDSIAWAKEFGKESFPYEVFKEYRRKLRRIYAALEENCSAAAYGESQVGKSYLMSSLLSSPKSPFVITNAGKSYSFIDDLNPSGSNNAKIESTGVITRFTLSQGDSAMKDFVKVRNLSVVDIILLLADSYYNDIKINQDCVLKYDEINKALEGMNSLWASKIVAQNEIDEDDIKDIAEGDIIETSLIGDLIAVSKNGSNIATIGRIYYNEKCVFYIFSASDNDSISNNPFGISRSRIYSFKIVNEMNEYVADFIPVRKDGVGYIYDRVSGELFGNQGTGAFIIGPDKTT